MITWQYKYMLKKGTDTKLPNDLILVHERSDHYSLQAAREMPLEGKDSHVYDEVGRFSMTNIIELNHLITSFYETYGTIFTKEQWEARYNAPVAASSPTSTGAAQANSM